MSFLTILHLGGYPIVYVQPLPGNERMDTDVRIDASAPVPVRHQDTAVIFDEQLSGLSDPIDVSAARTLRIVAATGVAAGCSVQAFIQYGASPIEARTDPPVNVTHCSARVVIFSRAD